MSDLALCQTCKVWHAVEMKPRAKETVPEKLPYGLSTLPKEFWTTKKSQ